MPKIKIVGNVDVRVEKILDLSDEEYRELLQHLKECKDDGWGVDDILGEYTDDLNDCCMDATSEDFELYKKDQDRWKFVEVGGE